jgi:hypothetical protein
MVHFAFKNCFVSRFGEDERTLATTIACNADALGIAVAYMICPWIVTQVNHIPYLLQIIAIFSFGNVSTSFTRFHQAFLISFGQLRVITPTT